MALLRSVHCSRVREYGAVAVASCLAATTLFAPGCGRTSDRSDVTRLSSPQTPDRSVVAFGPSPLDLDQYRSKRIGQATRESVRRASSWLAAFPEADLRFDAAIGLHYIRRVVDSATLREAWHKAKVVADRDDDHPMHRFWDPKHPARRERVHGWQAPKPGDSRANVNRVVVEALYCDVHGLRNETLEYLCGPMRDGGGYHTTHALWALLIARDRGCVEEDVFLDTTLAMQQELLDAQPHRLVPKKTLDIDLYAERTLMLALSGYGGDRADSFVQELIRCQSGDGGWGVVAENEPPYYRYHATMTSAWALSAVLRSKHEAPVAGQAPRQNP